MLRESQALWLAELWFAAQEKMPADSFLSRDANLDENRGWFYKVKCPIPGLPTTRTLLVCNLLIPHEGKIILLEDNRRHVSELLQNPQGFINEERLFEAFREPSFEKPEWFIRLKRSKILLDQAGIDAAAHVNVGRPEPVKMPIEVKSSTWGRDRYFEQYPERKGIVSVVIINPKDSYSEIRSQVYEAIEPLRDQLLATGGDFVQFFKKLRNRSLQGRKFARLARST